MKIYFLLLFLVPILYWNTLLIAQMGNETIFVTVLHTSCYLLRPPVAFSALRKYESTEYSSETILVTMENCSSFPAAGKWEHVRFPLVGHHIHLGISIMVNSTSYTFHDREMVQPIPYEEVETCSEPYAYTKMWYHTGVHTHCDNIVHIHPWSAPAKLRVEGREVRLKMWFESVGIEVSPAKTGLKLPGASEYITDWTLRYFVHVNDPNPKYETKSIEKIVNLWLVDHRGAIVLWSGEEIPKKERRVLRLYSTPRNYPSRYNM